MIYNDMDLLFGNIGSVRHFKKDEIIYHQGDLAQNFCYLKKGKVKVFMTSVDGMEKTLNTVSTGEIFGEGAFFDKKPRVSSAIAQSETQVIMIDEITLTELFSQNPKLAFRLLEILANRVRLLSFQLDSMTFLQADARIARILLENKTDGIINLTHEEIADVVGVSRVTVSKILGKLTKKGILSTEYRKIIIKDSKYLEEISKV